MHSLQNVRGPILPGRVRAKVVGTAPRPRLAVYCSNRAMYAQLTDDDAQVTIASARGKTGTPLLAQAAAVGEAIAAAARTKDITKVVFDRGGFAYTGRVRSLAEAARKNGLAF